MPVFGSHETPLAPTALAARAARANSRSLKRFFRRGGEGGRFGLLGLSGFGLSAGALGAGMGRLLLIEVRRDCLSPFHSIPRRAAGLHRPDPIAGARISNRSAPFVNS